MASNGLSLNTYKKRKNMKTKIIKSLKSFYLLPIKQNQEWSFVWPEICNSSLDMRNEPTFKLLFLR